MQVPFDMPRDTVTIEIRHVLVPVLRMTRSDGREREIELSPEQVRACGAGPLHISRTVPAQFYAESGSFKKQTDLYLMLAGNGDLLVRESIALRGRTYDLIPTRATEDVWYRFPRAD